MLAWTTLCRRGAPKPTQTNMEVKEETGSTLGKEHSALLHEALSRPGVREVMEVYRTWQAKDRELAFLQSVMVPSAQVTTSNSSSNAFSKEAKK